LKKVSEGDYRKVKKQTRRAILRLSDLFTTPGPLPLTKALRSRPRGSERELIVYSLLALNVVR
jgi:hypothetical protein